MLHLTKILLHSHITGVLLLWLCLNTHSLDRHSISSTAVWIELNKPFINHTLEGDMIFSPQTRYLPKGSSKLWPNARIPYSISPKMSSSHISIIQKSIQWFNSNTCIKWVLKEGQDTNYVWIAPSGGCRAMVGRAGGPQLLSLESNCFVNHLVVIHEMLHSIGFIHEHQRPDRDKYVTVYYQNIEQGQLSQFDLNTFGGYFGDYNVEYDIHSIMHYPEKAFSKGTQNTIVSRNGQQLGCFHLKQCPTALDVKKINIVYNCH